MSDSSNGEGSSLGRVLVVDDEAHVRSGLVQALTFLGYEAEEADSGPKALALLSQRRHDALILDMEMPGMNGVEVMHAARSLYGDLAIVILTGHGTLESAIDAVRSGVADYLLKPASIEQIGTTLAAAIAERRRLQQTQSLLQAIGNAVHGLQALETPPPPAEGATGPRYLHGGALLLDREKRTVMQEGCMRSAVVLSVSEERILEALMRRPGQLMSCRQLATEALAYDVEEYEAECLVRPHIFRLRQRLQALNAAGMVRTLRGRGYMFAPK